mgnify:CR=1 FL=1
MIIILILGCMNCSEMINKIYDYPNNHPERLNIIRECYSDAPTIIATFIIIILTFILTLIEKI